MNQNYKSLYNRALGAWVAAPENARRAGKKSKAHVETKRSPLAQLPKRFVLETGSGAGSASAGELVLVIEYAEDLFGVFITLGSGFLKPAAGFGVILLNTLAVVIEGT